MPSYTANDTSTLTDKERFMRICNDVFHSEKHLDGGIGTLSEKTLHAALKIFLEEDISCHEIKCGRYVADIKKGDEIIEIQTAGFNKLRGKLNAFLPDNKVTICYPIPHIKRLLWINPEDGTIEGPRKSPKTGSIYNCFFELYKISSFLTHPNLSLCLVLIDLDEYRCLNIKGRNAKQHSVRYERIPTALHDICFIKDHTRFDKLVPPNLSDTFTSKDFAKEAKITRHHAQTALNILTQTGTVLRVDKKGNEIVYTMGKTT